MSSAACTPTVVFIKNTHEGARVPCLDLLIQNFTRRAQREQGGEVGACCDAVYREPHHMLYQDVPEMRCERELIKNTFKECDGVQFFVRGQVVGVRLKPPTLTDAPIL